MRTVQPGRLMELARELARGPAHRVTLARAVLVGAVTVLIARGGPVGLLVTLASIALALDAVDGWVARRTGTASALGARFDMEVDAFLIFVLSGYVSRSFGVWVLAIGLARYAYVFSSWFLPWLREPTPPRYWCKVVAAIQGIVLTVAAADVLPGLMIRLMLVAALILLAESFGHDVWWQWRHRGPEVVDRPQVRRAAARVTTGLGFALVWFALVAPDHLDRLTPGAFLRIPIEGLIILVPALFLPTWPRRILAVIAGAVIGVLAIVKILNMGFFEALDRPFNPVIDWGNFGPAIGVLRDSVGETWTVVVEVAVAVGVVALLVLVTFALLRLTQTANRHRETSIRTITALAVVWVLCAVSGVQVVSGAPVASASAVSLARDQVDEVRAAVKDQEKFGATIGNDPFRDVPQQDLLTGLRGKDVIVAFVESYGQVAVHGSTFSPQVDAVLNAGTESLRAAGWSSQSAYLTSPTFGGISWLAHSTLQTGLWIDNQQRYNQVVASDRFTLSDAFKRAGWRTVADIPSNYQDWAEGSDFYHYDKVYDVRNVGYAGPRFSYATMPDQYVLSAYQRLELSQPNHAPVMGEIDLVSSHTPWAPLPTMVAWDKVGDGSVFDGMPQAGATPQSVWSNSNKVKAAYGQSVQYTMSALISFVENVHDDNLVLIVLGDHQPATIVSGSDPTHNVPISVIAHDPKVMDQIASWNWEDGLLPSPQAPVWPMNDFRDKFLTAFGS